MKQNKMQYRRMAVVVGMAMGLGAPLAEGAALKSYNADPTTVTTSGISSGGYMTIQYGVAYSASIIGVGIHAGGPVYCTEGSISNATGRCMAATTSSRPPVSSLITTVNSWSSAGSIDNVSNLANMKIYIFSGTNDSTVKQLVNDDLRTQLLAWIPSGNILYNNTTAAEHAWVTWKSGSPINACGTKADPYINNCSQDPQLAMFQKFFGSFNAKTTGALNGQFIEFDQKEFLDDKTPSSHSLADTGWMYVPSQCAANSPCKVHIAFHGCQQYYNKIGDKFVKLSGLNEYADTNDMIIVYPQTINQSSAGVTNPNGCWDWWAYDDANFAKKAGRQMKMVKRIQDRITGGWNPLSGNPAPTSLAVGTVTYNSAALSWSASTGATGYNVYRSGTSGGARTKVNSSAITGTAYTVTGLDPTTNYYFVVKAIDNTSKETADSNMVQTTTPSAPAGSSGVPGSVTTGSATENSVTVSWAAATGATGYNIYMGTSSTGTRTKQNTTKVTGTSFAVTGLSPSTTYYFSVRSVDSSDLLSAESSVVSGATTAPAYCKSFTDSNYNHVSAGRAYTSGCANFNACATGSGDSLGLNNTYTTTTLVEKPSGYFKKDGSCQDVPLSAPGTVTVGTITNNSVALSWSAGGGTTLAGYNVYYADNDLANWGKSNSSLVTGTAFTVTGLTANKKYNFYIKSASSAGQESQSSPQVSATTSTTTLAAPTGVTAGTTTVSTIPLSWTAVSGASGYNVYFSTAAASPSPNKGNSTLVTGTAFTLTSLAGSTTYYVTVRAVDSSNVEGAASTEINTSTQAPSAPNAPTSLSLGTGKTDTMIPLTWTDSSSSDVRGENVYFATTSGGPYTKHNADVNLVNGTTYNVTGLQPSTTYYFVVRAVNTSNLESANSNELSSTTNAPTGPAAPTNLAVTAGSTSDKAAALTWTASAGPNLSGYNVYVSKTTGVLGQKVNGGTLVTGTSYTLTSLQADTQYYVVLKGVNTSSVEGNASNEVSVKTLKSTYCKIWTDNNYNHVTANPKRATTDNTYAYSVGSGQNLGLYSISVNSTLRESPQGYFQIGDVCGTKISATSVAADDGYVKSTSCNTTGNTIGSLSTPSIGKGSDSACNRAFLSFDTSSIPDNAVITRAYVTVTYSSAAGDPWASPANNTLQVDVQNGTFNAASTETADYNATATASGVATIAKFTSGTKQSGDFSAAGLSAINLTGKTQLRLRFNSDPTTLNNYIIITEGTGATLTVEYIDPNN